MIADGVAFVDTNVAVYAWDRSDPRRAVAAALLPELLEAGRLRVSVQVLREFFVTVTRKVKVPLSVDDALLALEDLAAGGVQAEDEPMIRHAVTLQRDHRLSFWDALIVAAALRAGARTLYTEDLDDGQVIEGLRVVNPFL